MSDENLAKQRFYLLLDGEDGNDAFADGLTLDDIAIDTTPPALRASPQKERSGHLFNENEDANSLEEQKWGIIVPEGPRGDELFSFVADLVALREKEQGMRVVRFAVKANMDAHTSVDWVRNALGMIEEEDRPRYLLILGDLHEVSAELQVALSTRYFAGRLAFSHGDEYRAYVKKIIDYETTAPKAKQCKALVYSVHRTDRQKKAIEDAEQKLIIPLVTLSSERHEKGKIPVKFEWTNATEIAEKEKMLDIVGSAPVPTLFLSVSHGNGADPDRPEAEKQSVQGALVFDNRVLLTAEDAKSGPFLRGGFWFLFACFGAGTPKQSACHHWHNGVPTAYLPKSKENPYIAALPKAALANPEGPLAIVGHLDLALTSSYDATAGIPNVTASFTNQAARFTDLAKIANKNKRMRVGPIFGNFIRDLVDVNTKITTAVDTDKASNSPPTTDRKQQLDRVALWLLRQDLGAYILLGDPAAYLPFTRGV